MNVHPTKREVHFLDEDVIIDRVADQMQRALAEQSKSRTFEYQVRTIAFTSLTHAERLKTQTLLTGGVLDPNKSSRPKDKNKAPIEDDAADAPTEKDALAVEAIQQAKPTYSKDKIRVSQADRTLDSMFPIVNPATQSQVIIELDKDGSNVENEISKYRTADTTSKKRGRADEDSVATQNSPSTSALGTQAIEESECFLTSVAALRRDVNKARHRGP